MLVAIITLGLALLCLRWIRLAPLFRRIYEFRRAEAGEFTHLFRVFDELVSRAYGEGVWLPRPRLLMIRDAPCPAFTMGIRPPVIVLSAELVAQLGAPELRGIIAHELGHVRRLDYVGRWLATVLRDLMIWNPFAVWWYNRLLEEQEKACDESAAELVNDPAAVMRGLVEIAAHAVRLPVAASGPLTAWRRDRDVLTLKERLDRLEHSFVRPHGASMWPRLLLFPVLVAFLMIQPHATLCFRNLYAALSRAL
jgi:Zn-dependent protease with chaperone function